MSFVPDPSLPSELFSVFTRNGTIFVPHFDGVTRTTQLMRLLDTGALDPTFSAVVNGTINAIAVQNDNKLLIGGSFDGVGTIVPRIVRLNPDGSVDKSFGVSVTGYEIRSVAIQNDGKILIGGSFSAVDGNSRHNIARIMPDLTLEKPEWRTGLFTMTVQTTVNFTYQLEFKNNLSDPNWVQLPAVLGTGSAALLTDPGAPPVQRFYRLRLQ